MSWLLLLLLLAAAQANEEEHLHDLLGKYPVLANMIHYLYQSTGIMTKDGGFDRGAAVAIINRTPPQIDECIVRAGGRGPEAAVKFAFCIYNINDPKYKA